MSETILHQVKVLANDLSTTEKAQLIAWLGAGLSRELMRAAPEAMKETSAAYTLLADQEITAASPANGEAQTKPGADVAQGSSGEIAWEKRPWTEEEILELMKPEPKTGAEIAALIDQLDLSEWQATIYTHNVKDMTKVLTSSLVIKPY